MTIFKNAHKDEEFIEVAETACNSKGIVFRRPVAVRVGLFLVVVTTNAGHRGGNVVIKIKCKTKEVVSIHEFDH